MNVLVNSAIKRKGADQAGLAGGWFDFDRGGPVYGISCNHVIANINHCTVGDVLVDGHDQPIGTLTHWLVLRSTQESSAPNRSEFALFKPAQGVNPVWRNAKPSGFAAPALNLECQFDGPDLSSTGIITDVQHKVSIPCNGKDYRFVCAEITCTSSDAFSGPGHSGGIVTSSGLALGLILGTNDDKTYLLPFVDGVLGIVGLGIA